MEFFQKLRDYLAVTIKRPDTKIIVRNLPSAWTDDCLQNFLEGTASSLHIKENGIHVFDCIKHTALIVLEEPISGENMEAAIGTLASTPFEGKTLELELVVKTTNSLLVRHSDPDMSHARERLLQYFNKHSNGAVKYCNVEMYHHIKYAIVQFLSITAVDGALTQEEHKTDDGMLLQVEPWYEQFHARLLIELVHDQIPLTAKKEIQKQLTHIKRQKNLIDTLSTEMESRNGKIERLNSKIERQNGEVKRLSIEMERRNSEIEKQNGEIERLSTEMEIRNSKINRLNSEIEKQNSQIGRQNGEMERLGTEIERRNSQIKRLYSEIERLNSEIRRQNGEMERLSTEMEIRNSEIERQNSKIERQNSEIKRLKDEITNLKVEIEKTKAAALEKQEKEHNETLRRHWREYKRLKKQISELQNLKVAAILVPAYKLRLLTDFADHWEGCKVMLLEQEEKAMFYGTEGDCEEGKAEFLKHLQRLADYSLPEPACVIGVLKTAKGKRYFDELIRKYPKCSAQISTSCVMCAATDKDELQAFVKELERNIVKKVLQVPTSLTASPELQSRKGYWEKNYLVRLTLPSGNSEDVHVDGLNGHVDLVAREIETFTSLNRPGIKRFNIPGKLAGQACKKWFLPMLDETKQTIMKNGRIDKEETTDQGYELIFQCRQEVLSVVVDALNDIKYSINSTSVDLNKEFTSYADRALVVNGLNIVGKKLFFSQLAQKLERESLDIIGDFVLPEEHALPSFSFKQVQKGSRREGHRSKPRPHHRHFYPPPLPCTVTVGNAHVTFKSGDVTHEQADVLVSVLGSDIDMRRTAVGCAVLLKYPHLAKALQEQDSDVQVGSVITTPLSPTAQGATPTTNVKVVYHAILGPTNNPFEVVEQIVTKCLNLAKQNGLTSIAFPPLGPGLRFNYDSHTVACAIISAVKTIMLDDPGSLRTVSVVLKDKIMAVKFARVLMGALGTITVPVGTFTDEYPGDMPSAAEDDATTDTDEEKNASEQGPQDFKETPTGRFEALFCTTQDQDCKQIIDILLKELRTTFLCHETVGDVETFRKLADRVRQEILTRSSKINVLLTLSDKGIRLCGQKDMVQQMLLMIRDKMYAYVVEQSKQGWAKRKSLGLPVDTDHLPSYWTVCKEDQTVTYEKAIEIWKRDGTHTSPVTPDEHAAVERLMLATWKNKSEAANLKVISVERLENPELWRAYSQRREQLFNSLVENHSGSSAACYTSVEDLKGSRGPVLTTVFIGKDSPLNRDIYPQVNEHYFFHGTKKKMLHKIFSQGLDFRLAADGLVGRGVYGAESSEKSDAYTDGKIFTQNLKMFVMRMLLGEPFHCTKEYKKGTKFTRPPCMTCFQERCDCVDARLHNSVVDDERDFREFVVYDQNVCYPEYLITYKFV